MTGLLVLAVVWLGQAAYRVHAQRASIQVQLEDLESKIAKVQEGSNFLASSSAYFGSDEYLEKQARLKLNYKMPDEQVAFVYLDKGEPVASASQASSNSGQSWWRGWFKNLFD